MTKDQLTLLSLYGKGILTVYNVFDLRNSVKQMVEERSGMIEILERIAKKKHSKLQLAPYDCTVDCAPCAATVALSGSSKESET